jgi:hypothetical protein
MKSKGTHARNPAAVANTRWLAYATAGAASAFAGANSAEGTIHYSGPINQIFKSCARTHSFQLDRPGDFIRLRHTQLGCSSYNGTGLFNVGARAGASIAAFYNSGLNLISASNLKRGQLISNRPFIPAQSTRSAVLEGFYGQFGQFNGGIGYIGFKFNNGSGDQYGWVRIETRPPGETNPFILRDYAYGDVGDRVRAGQTSSNQTVSEEGSLGALALGAAGLLAWRKRRSRDAQATTRA